MFPILNHVKRVADITYKLLVFSFYLKDYARGMQGGLELHIVNVEEMRRIERYIMDEIGISAAVLMENAGREIAGQVLARCKKTKVKANQTTNKWAVLVGKGNNGGDGVVAARHLLEAGIDVHLIVADGLNEFPEGRVSNWSTETMLQLEIALRMGIPMQTYSEERIQWQLYDGIIDALLGTGSKGAPREPYAALIHEANASGLPILAVDIPSGLNADNGSVFEPCIQATATVALGFLKRGLVQFPGAQAAGEVIVSPIGIPPKYADRESISTFWMQPSFFMKRWALDPALP